MHSVVARSTFPSPMYKTQQPRSLLEVEMFKKCTPLWREATCRSQKCRKLRGYGALLDVQMSFRVAGARDCAPCQK